MSPGCPTCRARLPSAILSGAASRTTLGLAPTRSLSTTTPVAASRSAGWKYASHLRKAPTVPNPLPAIYPQTVLLSDGSSFTSYTTAPSPAILRLTRDVTNNPLWNPLKEGRRGDKEEEGGRLARFRARFGGAASASTDASTSKPASSTESTKSSTTPSTSAAGFGTSDFDWMSEGAVEQKVSAKDMAGPSKKSTKKK